MCYKPSLGYIRGSPHKTLTFLGRRECPKIDPKVYSSLSVRGQPS